MPISLNQTNGKIVFHVTSANAGFTLASMVTADETANSATVTSMTINQLFWSTNNVIRVLRGSNVAFTLYNSGFMDLAGSGDAYGIDKTANLMIDMNTTGTVVVEGSKDTTFLTKY